MSPYLQPFVAEKEALDICNHALENNNPWWRETDLDFPDMEEDDRAFIAYFSPQKVKALLLENHTLRTTHLTNARKS